MTKEEKLNLVYEDFVDMRGNNKFAYSGSPRARKKHRLYRIVSENWVSEVSVGEMHHKIAMSFEIYKVGYSDSDIDKIYNRWIASLPQISFKVEKA
jgi:hypothetical protein